MSTSLRITVEQFESMVDRGDFEPVEDHQVELIRGEIVPRIGDDPGIPMNPPHADTLNELVEWSFEVAPRPVVRISPRSVIRIPALDSEPLPDLAWLVRRDYSTRHPGPEDVLLLIEVADSSLAKDRGAKSELYAEAGIRDYWIVNLQNRTVEVHRDPAGLDFLQVLTFAEGDSVFPLAFPEVALPVSCLFPDRG